MAFSSFPNAHVEKTSANSLPKPGVSEAPCCPIFSRISATRGPTLRSGEQWLAERVQWAETSEGPGVHAAAKRAVARRGAGGHRGRRQRQGGPFRIRRRRRARTGPSPSGAIWENRKTSGKGKTAVDIDRKHVLIACAIAGAVLGVVLAVLQAVAPHTAGTRAH